MKNQSKKVFRMFAMILFICILSASIFMSIKITPIAAAENIGTKFVGYSADVTDLENATKNTSRNSNSPSITVLTHGLGSNASAWSNDQQKLAYNKDSLIEVLAGDRTKTVVYLASYKKSTDLNFQLQLLNDKDYTIKSNLVKLTQNDVSKHIILVFDDAENMDSNSAAYAKLNFVIDKILYDLQSLGVENPRINLIGHSRGGILNMMYANNHPYNVAGLYSIGTPYTGSTTYNLGKALLDIEPLANSLPSLSNTINSQGGRDIVDSALIDSNRTVWNRMINSSGIDAHAIGGAMSADMISVILDYCVPLLELKSNLGNVQNLNELSKLYEMYSPYFDLLAGKMSKILGLSPFIYDIRKATSIKGIIDNFYNTITKEEKNANGETIYVVDYDSFIVKLLSPVQIITIILGKTSMNKLFEKYEEQISEGKTENEIKENILKGTKLEDYTLDQIFNTQNHKTSICSRLNIEQLLSKFNIKIADFLPKNMTVADLFEGNDVNFSVIQSYIDDILSEIKFDISANKVQKVSDVLNVVLEAVPYARALLLTPPFLKYTATSLILAIAVDVIDQVYLDGFIESIISPYLAILQEFKTKSLTEFSEHWYDIFAFWKDEVVWLNDGFVNLSSQLATGYNGFKTYAKLFNGDNCDLFKQSDTSLPIPIVHNLELQDKDIINYITQNIDLGIADSNYYTYRNLSPTQIEILGIKPKFDISNKLVIPDTINEMSVISIADNAFAAEKYAGILEIQLPETIEKIGERAFSGCSSLEKINLPNSITDIGRFAFANCNISEVSFPESLTKIEAGVFYNCNISLTSLPEHITSIGELAFFNCNMQIFSIHKNLTYIGAGAFAGCSNLESFNVAYNNQNFKTNNGVLYNYNRSILLHYPEKKEGSAYTIETSVTRIESYAFYNSRLTSIQLPKVLTTIGEYAFLNNTNLTGIILPNSLVGIESFAFNGCTNLTEIIFLSETVPNLGWDIFDENNTLLKIKIPTTIKTLYQESLQMQKYASHIDSIKADIHFDSNGGNICESLIDVEYASEITFPNPIRKGYTFLGWCYSENNNNGFGEVITQTEWKQYTSTTIYAKWVINSYSINYHYNHPIDNSYSIENPSSYTIVDNFILLNPQCDGYQFDGWFDNAALSGSAITNFSNGEIGDKNLYGKWSPCSYTVFLNLNATDATCSALEVLVVFNSAITIPSPTRTGYYFDGWFTNASCNGTMYNTQSIWNIPQNTTLFAKWTLEAYEVQVSLVNENTGETIIKWWNQNGISDSKILVNYGIETSFYTFFRTYFRNEGYREGYDCTSFIASVNNFNNGIWSNVPDLGENGTVIRIVPDWQIETHIINYSANGGILSFTQSSGNYSAAIVYPTVSKTGYNFVNWKIIAAPFITSNDSPYGVGKIFSDSTYPDLTPKLFSSNSLGAGNITIEAQWETKQSTIIFNSNGGSIVSNKTNVPYGSVLSGIQTPTRIGYTFNGWFANPLFEGKKYENGIEWDQDIAGVAAPSITLYAKWTPTVYTITFDENGGSQVSDISYTILTPTFSLPITIKDSLTNQGWINSNNEIVSIVSKGSTGNLYLKARWHTNQYISINETKTITNTLAFMDFSGFAENVNSIYTFSSTVENVVLKGTTSKKYTNLRFEIAVRSTPLNIVLYNIDFKAHNNMNAIYALDATGTTLVKLNGVYGLELDGDCELNIECIGTNAIRGGDRTYYNWVKDGVNPYKYCSAIVCKNINIFDYYYSSSLSLFGGNGRNGIMSNAEPQENELRLRDGKPGGSAIWASYMLIGITDLNAYGGKGGNGAMGVAGSTGANGTKNSTKGKTGGNGSVGGNGGQGRYAFNVARKIQIETGSLVDAYGGHGGKGGMGGTGGRGGYGMDGALFRAAGTGGNGGNGGNGGASGPGYVAIQSMATIDGSFNSIFNGSNGSAGAGGTGGSGGRGGEKITGGYASSGNSGSNGQLGS